MRGVVVYHLSLNDLLRAIEIISVGPAYLRGLIGKQIYLGRAAGNTSLFSTLSASKLQKNLPEVERLFMESTNQLVTGDKITPGGFYTGVWCRDASYILNELVEMGRNEAAGRWLEWIWAHGVNGSINVVHGRGSPEMGYRSRVVTGDFRQKFDGLLPSSIQLGYIEVYGKSPDIDSTALMISVTCRYCSEATGSTGCDTLIRRVEQAITSLQNRDVDGDWLLEQGPNEDWMDTMLRSGRVVYSQAAWGRALLDWSKLLHKIGRSNDAEKTYEGARDLAKAINQKLWSEQSKSYSDSPEGYDGYRLDSDRVYAASQSSFSSTSSTNGNAAQTASPNTWLTQDASLFLLMMDSLDSASDGNNDNNYAGGRNHRSGDLPAEDNDDNDHRAGIFLETLKARSWRGGTGAACLDPPTSVTGPFKWGPHMYQNGGFWPWISSLEILARLRYDPSTENTADLLIKAMRYSFLEWVNPVGTGSGAYPFRTSIAAVRTALRHFSRTANR